MHTQTATITKQKQNAHTNCNKLQNNNNYEDSQHSSATKQYLQTKCIHKLHTPIRNTECQL